MKLFHQLLVAPAALGLLAPIAVNATEFNISDISSYSNKKQTKKRFDNNSFKDSLATNKSSDFASSYEAGGFSDPGTGGFSDTTVLSQTASFLVSAADGESTFGDEESVQLNYYYGMSLDTSFNGEDNLNIGIETGNTGTAGGVNVGQILDFGTSASDTLSVVDVNYTRSFGDLTVQAGDSLDASSQFTGACAYSGFTDHLADCGTGLSAGIGGDVTISSSYDFGNGLVGGFGITGTEGSTSDGLFTDESVDAYAAQLAYAADDYGISITYSNIDSAAGGIALIGVAEDNNIWGLNGYYTFGSFIDSVSVGYESANPETGKDTTNWFAGLTTAEVGPGSFSLGLGSAGHTDEDTDESLVYEASYSWDVNDSTAMTVGAFTKEQQGAGINDLSGVAWTTTFSF